MTEKTVEQIREEYGAEATRAMNERGARVEELARMRRPDGDAFYLERMSDEEREALLKEQKAELAQEDRGRLLGQMRAAHDRYRRHLEARREALSRRLFGAEDADPSLLAQTALAGEEDLAQLMDTAAASRNEALGRAVFLAAHRRNLGDLQARYFDEVDPEARELYNELAEAPTAETVERQREDIEQLIPAASPEKLAGTPPVNTGGVPT